MQIDQLKTLLLDSLGPYLGGTDNIQQFALLLETLLTPDNLIFLLVLFLHQLIGMIWYSPLMYQKQYMAGTRQEKGSAVKWYAPIICFALGGIELAGLKWIWELTNALTMREHLIQVAWIWLLFIFPTVSLHFLFDKRPRVLLKIYLLHHLVAALAAAALFVYLPTLDFFKF
ncbi:MAG: hypothetical protein SGCHY_000067 [Lobulomycetales sp.]